MGVQLYHNCRILRGEELVRDELWVEDGVIVSAETVRNKPYERINCHNGILSPGFIDIQINGAYGVDFTSTKDITKALEQCSRFMPKDGVTAYVPTVITSAPETYHARVTSIKYTPGGAKGASVLGSHLEGPFISRNKRGCHPPELIQSFDQSGMAQIHRMYGDDLSDVLIVTLAPEYPHSMPIIEGLSKTGIIVSLGHSEATYEIGEQGIAHGASKLTHLFSAMNGFGHRQPSLPGLICGRGATVNDKKTKLLNTIMAQRSKNQSSTRRPSLINIPQHARMASNMSDYCPSALHYGLIADGVHVHPASLRIAYRLNKRGLCLVTDAIGALGLPDGKYNIGDTSVDVFGKPRRAIKVGTDTLAGVVASMDECVRYFLEVTGCSIGYVLNAASLHPAECLGISSIKGHLGVGADADIVLLNDQLEVQKTWVLGELAYDKETWGNPEIPLETAASCNSHLDSP